MPVGFATGHCLKRVSLMASHVISLLCEGWEFIMDHVTRGNVRKTSVKLRCLSHLNNDTDIGDI